MKMGNREKLDKSIIAVLSEYAPIEALAEYKGAREERMEKVELTLGEAETLTDLIELYIFDIIRNDEEIDNINWLKNVMSIHEKCKQAEKGGDNEAE